MKRGIFGWYSLLGTPTQQRTDATDLLTQRGTPYRCLGVVSGSKFDGGVSVDNAMLKMVRSLDVKAAQAHMARTTGTPFVAAPSEVNGRFYSADENALIALHKLRTQLGSPEEITASKWWLRAQGLTGLYNQPLLYEGKVYAFVVGFNEWVLKSFVKEVGWRRTKSKDA